MTIDAYDWKHRSAPTRPTSPPTTCAPAARPAPGCTRRPSRTSGSTCCEYYADPDEEAWVNEGLSDFAQTLAGYVDGDRTVHDRGNDNHLVCFQGFGNVKTKFNINPRECGGPQNSLNLWDEGTPTEVLADYGNAYQFLLYLRDRFGIDDDLDAAPGRPAARVWPASRPRCPPAPTSTTCCTTSRP